MTDQQPKKPSKQDNAQPSKQSDGTNSQGSRGAGPDNPNNTTGRTGESRSGGTNNPDADVERASGGTSPDGSGTSEQHVSGYGGSMGEPRTSSDQREPQNIEDSKNVSDGRGHAALGDGEAGDGAETERLGSE